MRSDYEYESGNALGLRLCRPHVDVAAGRAGVRALGAVGGIRGLNARIG